MIRSIAILLSTLNLLSAATRQATQGRCWLLTRPGEPVLGEVRVSRGSIGHADWEKDPQKRAAQTDISFPIHDWDWREIVISFTPSADGTIDFVLNGPWEAETKDQIFREEVLWDDISAEGTTVENGSFEMMTDAGPEHWRCDQAPYPAASEWPLANAPSKSGQHVGATWHNRPLKQELRVKAAQPVTLKLHARAAALPGTTAMKPMPANTAASREVASIKRGVNLSNSWEAPPPYSWGIRYTTEDVDRIAAEGFDHIRVPIAWHFHLKGDTPEIDPALLADLEPVLRRALEKHLHVIIDWHHFDDLTTDPVANRKRFIAGWSAIAKHFASWPQELWFELLNEPRDALTTEVANSLYADTLAAIRSTNPSRIVLVSPGNWGDVRELDKLRLPEKDDRLVVTVHCYEPFYFTHQGAGWVQLQALKGIVYPGPPATPLAVPDACREMNGVCSFIENYNTAPTERNPSSQRALRDLLDDAAAWSAHFGRPVHLGEFGTDNIADPASRERYARDVRTLAEARHVPWTLWDWKAMFGYWDSQNNKPLLRAALFDASK